MFRANVGWSIKYKKKYCRTPRRCRCSYIIIRGIFLLFFISIYRPVNLLLTGWWAICFNIVGGGRDPVSVWGKVFYYLQPMAEKRTSRRDLGVVVAHAIPCIILTTFFFVFVYNAVIISIRPTRCVVIC